MNSPKTHEVGMFVHHPAKPEWGLGKILQISGNKLYVFFKGDKEEDYRTFRTDKISLEIVPTEPDAELDNLPPFLDSRFGVKAKKVSFDDVVADFSRQFPLGFSDPKYLGGDSSAVGDVGERNYKLAAHDYYVTELGNGRGETLLERGDIDQLNDIVYKFTSSKKIEQLSRFETMAIRDGLLADKIAAQKFYAALFNFVALGKPDERRFNALATALSNLPVKKGASRVATWPLLTFLPFFAKPECFMFLKPDPTKECAERLRFDIQYSPQLRWITYKKLMEMSDLLLEQLQPLGARDYIDVQSFIWVIAKY